MTRLNATLLAASIFFSALSASAAMTDAAKVASSMPAAAAAIPGPAVGTAFPHQLGSADQTGKSRDLKSLMGAKGLALFFVRSADWCPYCKHQLADANQHLPDFQKLGVNVASISVDTVELVAGFAAAQHIGYPMLADPKGDINLAIGIRDEQYPLGSKAFGVPRPIVYIIDRSGKIRAIYMEPTYKTRPDLAKVLADVAALKL